MNKDNLGDRMKSYENCYRNYLPSGFYTIIRVDMRAGHTFTKGFYRPFDTIFMESMKKTAEYLCGNIQGAVFAYTQSDEISILIDNTIKEEKDYQPWFGNNIQKIVSVSASMATMAFNEAYNKLIFEYPTPESEEEWKIYNNYCNKLNHAMFDSRVFILPKDEVPNMFLWRVKDMERNSIQMVARSLYSHKELVGKKSADLHELIHQKGQNWNNYPGDMKHGTVIVKHIHSVGDAWRTKWGPMDDGMFPDSNYKSWNTFVNRFVEKLDK